MKISWILMAAAGFSIFSVSCGAARQTQTTEKRAEAPPVDTSDAGNAKTGLVTDLAGINVSKNGFEPAEISVEKGRPTKIAFTRIDEQNCGSEVVFPKLNVTRKLPVGETVSIEINPADTGEIAFTCGMGMMRGKILVQ